MEVGPPGSGVEFSLPLHRNGGAPAQMVNIILEELNEIERRWDASEMNFVPTCSPYARDGKQGKENGELFSEDFVDASQLSLVGRYFSGLGVDIGEAMEGLLTALRNTTPIIALDCPKCGHPHLDQGEAVVVPSK